MFCCTPNALHYASFIQENSSQIFINEESTLKERLKINKTQTVLPSSFSLSLQNPFAIQIDQITISQSDYSVKVSEQVKTIEIKEIKKQNFETLWKVLKENQTDQIMQDDIFGFGPYDFKVYQIGKKNEPQLQEKQYQTETNCRICFTNQTSEKNPLMSFCECIGSIKYQHLNCLKQWIKEGSRKNQFQTWSYIQYSKLACNVCKKSWNQKVKQNKRNYYLYQAEQSEQERRQREGTKICLSLSTFAEEDDRQSLLVVKFYLTKTTNFIIGANENECDLILDNINVSSMQCQLVLENQKLVLKDLNSYYGTSIKLRNNYQKEKQKQLSYFSFSSKKGILLKYNGVMMHIKAKESFFSCFDAQETYKITYCHYS